MRGEALYYGLNALSNNLLMADRKRLKNPNGLFLGTPGSGKSFAAKREIINVFLITEDDIIISDPEAEYFPLVQRLGGQVIKLSPNSPHYINPRNSRKTHPARSHGNSSMAPSINRNLPRTPRSRTEPLKRPFQTAHRHRPIPAACSLPPTSSRQPRTRS